MLITLSVFGLKYNWLVIKAFARVITALVWRCKLAKSKKSDLERLNNQLNSLQKQLIFAPSKQSSNKMQLQIIAVKKKIIIADQNKRSK